MKLHFIKNLLPLLAVLPLSVQAQNVTPLQKRTMTLDRKTHNKNIVAERIPAS